VPRPMRMGSIVKVFRHDPLLTDKTGTFVQPISPLNIPPYLVKMRLLPREQVGLTRLILLYHH
jgi:hypothetical protein